MAIWLQRLCSGIGLVQQEVRLDCDSQSAFFLAKNPAKGILDLTHSDVFGPIPVPSLGKSVYYVSFIDDFSRKTWIYFLRKKSEVFNKFKEFKALVENQTEKKIK
jgi:hypothetical protein